MNKHIAILGCGWLGLPLAEQLVLLGYQVTGSCTSPKGFHQIRAVGATPFHLLLREDIVEGDIINFLKKKKKLVIAVPPGIRKNPHKNFVNCMQRLIPFIEQSEVIHVMFMSSTSVFGKTQGVVDETTLPIPDSENGKQLLNIERLLGANSSFSTSIVRLGGLIGNDRHPVYHLAGRKQIAAGNAPINLIALVDVLEITLQLLQKPMKECIIHAVAPFHPSRKNYYSRIARQLQLEPPEFNDRPSSTNKTVKSIGLKKNLNYLFINPHLKV